jgi:DNA-binding LytR/AlgR family response regulator
VFVESFAYRLQRLDAGVILIDDAGRIRSFNPTAERLLGRRTADVMGQDISVIHPTAVHGKLDWLLKAVRTQETAALAVTLPQRALILKATALEGVGICLLLYPVDHVPEEPKAPAPLVKLPVSCGSGVELLPLEDVVYLRAEGHYTLAATATRDSFCPLSLSELETRLDRASFLRVHRSFIVNLRHVSGMQRIDGRTLIVTPAATTPLIPVSRARLEAIQRLFAV